PSAEIHAVDRPRLLTVRVARQQDLSACLSRPFGTGEEDAVARRLTAGPRNGDPDARQHSERGNEPKNSQESEAGRWADHQPRSLIRNSIVSTTSVPRSAFHVPRLTLILTASGALTGEIHSRTQCESAP